MGAAAMVEERPEIHTGPRGWVYFVEAEGQDLIKIGFTARLPRFRLAMLRQGSPVPIEPLGVIPCRASFEGYLHRRFRALRRRYEWFEPDRSLVRFIKEFARPWPEGDVECPISEEPPPWLAGLTPYLSEPEAAALLGCTEAELKDMARHRELPHIQGSPRRRVYGTKYLVQYAQMFGLTLREPAPPNRG